MSAAADRVPQTAANPRESSAEGERLVLDIGDGVDFMALGARVHRVVHPSTVNSRALGVSIVLMGPGERIKRHRHTYEESYYIVSGEGTMYLEGVGDIDLLPGRCVYVPPGRIHGQLNTSASEELRIVCSLSPPPPEGESPELFE